MEDFARLFGGLLAFVYHCFDRIVIRSHLPLLTRPENIVHFFRDVHGIGPITKEVLRQRTTEYHQWVEAFARNRKLPMEWAEKGMRKEDYVRPWLQRTDRQGRCGVYFILKSMEVGTSFRSAMPKYPTADPNYRILSRQRSRFTHYYFYIRDPVLGPIALCVGSFLPFSITYYLNGHHFIEQQLRSAGVKFRKNDNAFLWVADPQALQAAADRLNAQIIRTRLEYWSLVVGPKFSTKDRHAINLSRYYSIQQVEYCRNLIFRRNFPIHKLFERSCDLGLLRLCADSISQIFGWRLHKRWPGQLTSKLDQIQHGHHVLRAYAKNAVIRMYEKFSTFLRLEALSNNLKDFGLKKGLDNLDQVRRTLATVTDRFAAFEARALNVHVDFHCSNASPCPLPLARAKPPESKFMTPVCCASWKCCCTPAPRSWDGAPPTSIKRSFPASVSHPPTTPLPNCATTCANSRPTDFWSETADAMPIVSPTREPAPPCSSSFSTNACAARSPTASSTAAQPNPPPHCLRSKPPITRPTALSIRSSNY